MNTNINMIISMNVFDINNVNDSIEGIITTTIIHVLIIYFPFAVNYDHPLVFPMLQ